MKNTTEQIIEELINELREEYQKFPFNSSFIVHDHYASHHHFDLRIKKGKKLASWALPKAIIPDETGGKVLAVKTPDHPLYWMYFQGTIPEGEYGAGEVKIYDKGSCVIYSWDGKIVVDFHGDKVKGFYAIIPSTKDYLMIRMDQDKAKKQYKNKQEEE